MSLSGIVGRIVALIGAVAILVRRQGRRLEQAVGSAPAIPAARPQGIPTLKMPTARGWTPGQTPVAAPGLKVNAFATGLKHPRWIHVLPNGDVLVAEALTVPGPLRTVFDYAMISTMKRAAAVGASPNRITLLRDADGDGVAETRETFLEGLNQPFGMALLGDTFYVGNTDGVVAFPYTAGATRITAPGRKLDRPSSPAGTGRAACCPAPTGASSMSASARSPTSATTAWQAEEGRAAHPRARPRQRQQPHLRLRPAQPGGPGVGAAHRRAVDGGQRARRPGRRDAARLPDLGARRRLLRLALLLLGPDGRRPRAAGPGHGREGHHAGLRAGRAHRSLGLCWLPAGTLPGFPDGMAIGQHGSWNRSTLSGYRVVFVPFANGRPAGPPRDILTGFLAPDERESYGRPVGVTLGPDGSLLVADDVGDVIWRVTGDRQG